MRHLGSLLVFLGLLGLLGFLGLLVLLGFSSYLGCWTVCSSVIRVINVIWLNVQVLLGYLRCWAVCTTFE